MTPQFLGFLRRFLSVLCLLCSAPGFQAIVGAVYDRPRSRNFDIVGGHRPPLQKTLSASAVSSLRFRLCCAVFLREGERGLKPRHYILDPKDPSQREI